jgi:D-alanyl-D-alanine carboxypeptidase
VRRLLALLAALAAPAAAQEPARDDVAVRARFEQAVAGSGFQGVYALSSGGRRLAGGAIGEAAPGTPFAYEMVFPWASVTKQVVATMVMQEVAAGRVALDAPASRYLPELRRGGRSPTVRELLQHRSGLRNPDDSPADATGFPSFYKTGPTGLSWCYAGRGSPGGNWRYNNCDYLALGALLERVAKRPLPELYVERIGSATGVDARFVIGPGETRADADWRGGPDDAFRTMLARFGAAGGLVGTADDMLGFDQALMSGALLLDRDRAEMWRGDPELGYQALGQWSFDAPLKGCAGPVRLVERRGAIGRFQVRNVIAPDRGMAMVLLTNRGEPQGDGRAEGAFDFGEIWRGRGPSHDLLAAALCP